MGMDGVLMLYTEDTYEVKERRPSISELTEADTAQRKSVKWMIMRRNSEDGLRSTCIQTLAHLHNALKWPGGEKIKDTADILQVGKEETYQFIRKDAEICKRRTFHTDRVHRGNG